jgi:hypothetical protein
MENFLFVNIVDCSKDAGDQKSRLFLLKSLYMGQSAP